MSECRLPPSGPVDLAVRGFQSRSTISLIILTAITALITINLLVDHARCRTKDGRMRFIIPIATLPLVYALISLFSIIFYSAAGYLEPLSRVFEAFAIVSFYSFIKGATNSICDGPVLSRGAHVIIATCVYQLAITLPLLTIATEVLGAKFCSSTLAFRAGRVVINVCALIVIVFAIIGIFLYLRKTRIALQNIRPVRKFLVLKIIIVLVTLEYLIIDAAVQKTHIASRTQATFFDWYRGLPAVVVGCEMPLCAALMHWAFPAHDHTTLASGPTLTEAPMAAHRSTNQLQK